MPRKKNPDTVAKNTAYKNAYLKDNYERINLFVPKGCKAVIKAAANKGGFKSLNQYIITALEWYDGLDLSGNKKL